MLRRLRTPEERRIVGSGAAEHDVIATAGAAWRPSIMNFSAASRVGAPPRMRRRAVDDVLPVPRDGWMFHDDARTSSLRRVRDASRGAWPSKSSGSACSLTALSHRAATSLDPVVERVDRGMNTRSAPPRGSIRERCLPRPRPPREPRQEANVLDRPTAWRVEQESRRPSGESPGTR